MIEYNTVVPVGAKMKCLSARYYPGLTEGKVYECLHGLEAGIFTSRPFVSVIGDDGKKLRGHASRFTLEF